MSEEMTAISQEQVCKILDDMASSMASTRETIQSIKARSPSELETKNGISLLSLKHHLMLSYLHSLTLVSSRKALGHSLNERTSPKKKFTNSEREERGANAGDLVDTMIEGRVILEKVKALEGRMRYQIEKLVKAAQREQDKKTDVVDGSFFLICFSRF
jgi:U3 small nucleolar ribonucleoprotein protein LCP5